MGLADTPSVVFAISNTTGYIAWPWHRKHFYSGVSAVPSRGVRGHAPLENFRDYRHSQIVSGAIGVNISVAAVICTNSVYSCLKITRL